MALSVSISARISPSSTVSPIFFNHVATVPSSIVSLKRGIVTTITPSGKASSLDSSLTLSVTSSALSSVDVSVCASTEFPLIKPEISSPSSPIIAKRVSTFAVSPS